jgi:hypothetical protein
VNEARNTSIFNNIPIFQKSTDINISQSCVPVALIFEVNIELLNIDVFLASFIHVVIRVADAFHRLTVRPFLPHQAKKKKQKRQTRPHNNMSSAEAPAPPPKRGGGGGGSGAVPSPPAFASNKDYLGPISATPQKMVEEMLAMAGVGADDVVFDLGCNDGRVCITAAKAHGARGVGIEIDAGAVDKAKRLVRGHGFWCTYYVCFSFVLGR